jgi:hypothetical protein
MTMANTKKEHPGDLYERGSYAEWLCQGHSRRIWCCSMERKRDVRHGRNRRAPIHGLHFPKVSIQHTWYSWTSAKGFPALHLLGTAIQWELHPQ